MGSDDEQEPTQTARSPRQTAWLGECAFSAIALAAHLTAVNDREAQGGPGASRHDKWTASVMIVNMSLAFLSTLAHHFSAASDRFVGKLSEGITAALVLALWCAGLPAVMDPDWDQAVDQNAEIQNANLYFSSWAALAVVIFVFGSYVTQHHLKGHDFSTEATPLSTWYMLTAASVVVMVSSIRIFQSDAFEGQANSYQQRTKYAMSTGAAGTAFGLVACVMGSRGLLKTYPEAGMAFVLFAMYVAAIAIVTFGGDKAPADNMGNLYFSTWIGFVIAFVLSSKSFQEVKHGAKGGCAKDKEAAASDKKEEEAEEGEAKEGDAPKKEEDQAPPEAPVDVSGE